MVKAFAIVTSNPKICYLMWPADSKYLTLDYVPYFDTRNQERSVS